MIITRISSFQLVCSLRCFSVNGCERKAHKYFYGEEGERLAKGLSGMINCSPTIMGIQFLAFCGSSFLQQGEQLNDFVFASAQEVHGQLSTYLALKEMQRIIGRADLTAA